MNEVISGGLNLKSYDYLSEGLSKLQFSEIL